MTSFTDDIMALADVYAEALLRAAEAQGQQDEVAAQAADLRAYMQEHPQFAEFLRSASLDDDARRESLEKVFRGRLNDLLLNTLQVLNRRNRLHLAGAVARAIELRMEKKRNQQEVVVETAVPLPDDVRDQLQRRLTARMGKEALLIEQVQPDLIGGFVLHVGDQRLDASIAQRIRAIRSRLSDRATHEIHRGDGQYILEG
jgi:F-type H+-transporting ATPase subunit delta